MSYRITSINEKNEFHNIRRSSAICIETGTEVRILRIPEEVKVGSIVSVNSMSGPGSISSGIVRFDYNETISI